MYSVLPDLGWGPQQIWESNFWSMESMDAHKWGPSPPADLEFLKIYVKIDYVLLELHLRFRAPADLVGKSSHMITRK